MQGTDGHETVSVDNLGKVLKIDENTRVAPIAGNDVQITIDTDWQSGIYEILKQRVAGILLSKIEASKTFDFEGIKNASQIRIPIYDVYNALVENSVIDINKFQNENASDIEKNLYAKFQQKQQQVFDIIDGPGLQETIHQLTRMKIFRYRHTFPISVMTCCVIP